MFIKPLDTANLPRGEWIDKAGNHHFALQQRKATIAQSQNPLAFFFAPASATTSIPTTVTSQSGSSGATSPISSANIKAINAYDYRIILRCSDEKSRKLSSALKSAAVHLEYVVAVDDSFERIHNDWNWVENNLFLKLLDLEAESTNTVFNQDGTHSIIDLDKILLKQFEEITDEFMGQYMTIQEAQEFKQK
ncbi:hypothetical protein HK100_004748 [Physocladia obscura]|uniref:Uncharacterized protein n=1 Tax=Physocladia obscura TaxID=109957 RepID=A0AAD5TAE5_9FUNG|nr:hypothetical protein HK100_004748 [Physocladia obscura]